MAVLVAVLMAVSNINPARLNYLSASVQKGANSAGISRSQEASQAQGQGLKAYALRRAETEANSSSYGLTSGGSWVNVPNEGTSVDYTSWEHVSAWRVILNAFGWPTTTRRFRWAARGNTRAPERMDRRSRGGRMERARRHKGSVPKRQFPQW